jgi:hypothetical protein
MKQHVMIEMAAPIVREIVGRVRRPLGDRDVPDAPGEAWQGQPGAEGQSDQERKSRSEDDCRAQYFL